MNPFEVAGILFLCTMVILELGLVFIAVWVTVQQYLEEREQEREEARKDREEAP